jgi:hypothetical protein
MNEGPQKLARGSKAIRLKKLVPSYELSWRTRNDEEFAKSSEWRNKIRPRILLRDNYTCQYCGFRSEKGMNVAHIDGNPKNNQSRNLEVVCGMCHMITHAGLWCAIFGVVDLYAESKYSQNEIIKITREMREKGKRDDEIISFLGLRTPMPWRQDLKYLSRLYGFVSSRQPRSRTKPLLTEEEQRRRLSARGHW